MWPIQVTTLFHPLVLDISIAVIHTNIRRDFIRIHRLFCFFVRQSPSGCIQALRLATLSQPHSNFILATPSTTGDCRTVRRAYFARLLSILVISWWRLSFVLFEDSFSTTHSTSKFDGIFSHFNVPIWRLHCCQQRHFLHPGSNKPPSIVLRAMLWWQSSSSFFICSWQFVGLCVNVGDTPCRKMCPRFGTAFDLFCLGNYQWDGTYFFYHYGTYDATTLEWITVATHRRGGTCRHCDLFVGGNCLQLLHVCHDEK